MRSEKIGGATLYLGDMRDVILDVRGARVLLTDAPYPVTRGGQSWDVDPARRWAPQGAEGIAAGKLVEGHDIGWSTWLGLAYDALDERAHAYLMASHREMFAAYEAAIHCKDVWDEGRLIERGGFDYHNTIPWDKGQSMQNRWYKAVCEFVVFLKKGTAYAINDCASRALVSFPQKDETDHPTEKPVPLMDMFIRNSSKAGEVILDPFMGTGTTCVAAERAGRASIGIEITEKWFTVACRRVERAANERAQGVGLLGDLLAETVESGDIFADGVDG